MFESLKFVCRFCVLESLILFVALAIAIAVAAVAFKVSMAVNFALSLSAAIIFRSLFFCAAQTSIRAICRI